MIYTDKKEPISFQLVVAGGASGSITERIKNAGTIESLKVKFYAGQQRDFIVKPKIKRTGNRIENILTYPDGADQFLAGDDQEDNYDVAIDVEIDDEILIEYENLDPVNAYTLNVSLSVDYLGGKNRVV